MARFLIYPETDIKGIKKREGTAVYRVESCRGSDRACRSFAHPCKGVNEAGAKLVGVARALQWIAKFPDKADNIEIVTDSDYIGMGFYLMKTWKARDWKTSGGRRVANAEAWKTIEAETAGKAVEIRITKREACRHLRELHAAVAKE